MANEVKATLLRGSGEVAVLQGGMFEIAVLMTVDGRPAGGFIYDFVIDPLKGLSRQDEGERTDADGVARATFVADAEGPFTGVFHCFGGEAHTELPFEGTVTFRTRPETVPYQDRSSGERRTRESVAADPEHVDTLRPTAMGAGDEDRMTDEELDNEIFPNGNRDAIHPAAGDSSEDEEAYGDEAARASVMSQEDLPVAVPAVTAGRRGMMVAIALMGILAVCVSYQWLSQPTELTCGVTHQGGKLHYSCVSQ